MQCISECMPRVALAHLQTTSGVFREAAARGCDGAGHIAGGWAGLNLIQTPRLMHTQGGILVDATVQRCW